MPTYAYRCRKCGHEFEEFHGMRDTKPRRCPKCKGRADRVPAGGVGLLFKGSGFYITDNRSKDYQEKAKKDSPTGGSPPAEKKRDGDQKTSGGKSSGGD